MRKLVWMSAAAGAATAWFATRARRMSLAGKGVLITGGSRGLGLELARAFSEQGARLALLARDAEELERAAAELRERGADVITVACDLRDEQATEEAVHEVAQRLGRLDVLVNNAGVIQVGPLEHLRVEDFRETMDVHFYGPLIASLAARPYLADRGGGRLVNITSIDGRVGFPHLSAYNASKHAAVGLSESLRAELHKEGILVTTVIPGLMRTGSPRNVDVKGQHEKEYAWFSVSDALPLVSADATRAARRIVRATERGDAELYITPHAKVAAIGQAAFPGLMTSLFAFVDRLLPAKRAGHDAETKKGHESESEWAPSPLTHLSDVAAAENNEIRP